MSSWFYVTWYLSAFAVTLVVWVATKRIRARFARLAWRLAAVALGFTTVPMYGPDGGLWLPIGLYYFTGWPHRLEAWRKATVVVGCVWVLLVLTWFAVEAVWSVVRGPRGTGRPGD